LRAKTEQKRKSNKAASSGNSEELALRSIRDGRRQPASEKEQTRKRSRRDDAHETQAQAIDLMKSNAGCDRRQSE
jgi:hypothetical protein